MTPHNTTPLAATGLATAPRATPQLVSSAVSRAIDKLNGQRPAQVLLFLSADFAADPHPAIIAAGRAAQTTAIAGCTALGVLNEEEWIWDAPAACAIVFAAGHAPSSDARFSLAAPNTLDLPWLEQSTPRYGGTAGDTTGLGLFKVWNGGQINSAGRCEMALPSSSIAVSRGLQTIGQTYRVTASHDFDVQTLDHRNAATTLRRAFDALPPTHELALAILDDHDTITEALPIVSINPDGGVTIAGRLLEGERVQWAHRQPLTALEEIQMIAKQPAPRLALVFSCGGRGPEMHQGKDLEWDTLRRAWPDTPIAGFYGNGQIAHLGGANRLLHQCVVVASFA